MRLGTRALALTQARWVAQRLGPDVEVVPITTLGDRGATVQDKSRWVSELERALLDGRIDIAVHSAKDVPTELDAGLELIAVPERADARDAICGARERGRTPARPSGLTSVHPRSRLYALATWGMRVIRTGETTVIPPRLLASRSQASDAIRASRSPRCVRSAAHPVTFMTHFVTQAAEWRSLRT